jgi:hypothetical protein
MRITLQHAIACCIVGFALSACGGGSGTMPAGTTGTSAAGNPSTATGTPAAPVTFPMSSSPSTQNLPAIGGISGTMTIPATTGGSGIVSVQASTTAPASAPTAAQLTQSSSRRVQSGTLSFYFFTTLTFSTDVTLASLPGFSLTLPSSIPTAGGSFFYAIQDPASSAALSFRTEGPATANGQTITFIPSPNPITFKANQNYVIAFYEISGPPNTNYSLLTNIGIPGIPTPASGPPFSFDISFVDSSASRYYLADRTSAGIDVVNTKTNTLLGTAKGFTGAVLSNPTTVNNNLAGPNGVASIGGTLVAAADGDSTLKIVDTGTLSIVATQLSGNNPFTGTIDPKVAAGCVNPAGGITNHAFRLDELAYDPADKIILAINDADCPPYGTFFSGTAPYNVLGTVSFGTSFNGVEQPVWDPNQKLFLLANPQTIANPNGEIDTIDPHSHAIMNRFTLPAACTPHGLALGPNDQVVLGCNVPNSQIFVMNAKTGAIVGTVPGYGGSDECWYNAGDNRYYCALSSQTPGPVIAVVDAGTFKLLATIPTSTQAHSVAVDAATNHVFVPQRTTGISVFSY